MGRKKKIISNPLIVLIVKSALKVILRRMLNIKLNLPAEIARLEPPYLLLANHQGFWDPFAAGIYLKGDIFFITSDAVFRSRLFSFLLKFLGAVPKTKSQSDLDALKYIFEIKDRGRSIGIFPEGQRTWDGCTLPLIQSTAKLVRMLKLPVVTAVLKGGFFTHPRWGVSIRKGRLTIDYRMLLSGEECAGMKISEIHRVLTEALEHDEIEYQKKEQIRFSGGRHAENIEQFIFACPGCREHSGFSSEGSRFQCRSCGKEWIIDDFQVISPAGGEGGFDNLRDWNRWQLDFLRESLDRDYGTGKTLIEDAGVVFHTGYRSKRLTLLSEGSVRLDSSHLYLLNSAGTELLKAPIEEITGMNIQNREVLDFYHRNILYTIRDKERRFSSYRLMNAVDYIQREKLRKNIPV